MKKRLFKENYKLLFLSMLFFLIFNAFALENLIANDDDTYYFINDIVSESNIQDSKIINAIISEPNIQDDEIINAVISESNIQNGEIIDAVISEPNIQDGGICNNYIEHNSVFDEEYSLDTMIKAIGIDNQGFPIEGWVYAADISSGPSDSLESALKLQEERRKIFEETGKNTKDIDLYNDEGVIIGTFTVIVYSEDVLLRDGNSMVHGGSYMVHGSTE